MRLKSIKLAGFKSFVDPTTVAFPGDLTAIVGPNGCGKSNIIDAVRWVMGESSAKHLRGESMSDVIFNGSVARKPVGQAAIELEFDNSDGSVGGEYAAYTEIALRRTVSRDGLSQYFVNGTRCRRRDITDIFLGTGLGPKSYAIIEQGMISRLIEARPEELRGYIEEAAGISKYKDRRRDTENRIRRTRENLERLRDLREELERQIQHLDRQAKAAERYSELKAKEESTRAELLAQQWRRQSEQLSQQRARIAQIDAEFEALNARRVSIDRTIEEHRLRQADLADELNTVQENYFALGSEISRTEQTIQYQHERASQLREDLQQARDNHQQSSKHILEDEANLKRLENELGEISPQLRGAEDREAAAVAELAEAEQRTHRNQQDWEEFHRLAQRPQQQAQVLQARIGHLEQALAQGKERLERLVEDELELSSQPIDRELASLKERMSALEEEQLRQTGRSDALSRRLSDERQRLAGMQEERQQTLGELQVLRGRNESLLALQQAALENSGGQVQDWLQARGLHEAERLYQHLRVDPGWELAVETVLGDYLQAVCTDALDPLLGWVGELEKGSLTLFFGSAVNAYPEGALDVTVSELVPLKNRVRSRFNLDGLFDGVFCVDTVERAAMLRNELGVGQSIVTQDGIWIGQDWLRIARDSAASDGIISRQRDLEELSSAIDQKTREELQLNLNLEAIAQGIEGTEQELGGIQQDMRRAVQEYTEVRSDASARQASLDQMAVRRQRNRVEQAEIRQLAEDFKQQIERSRIELESCLDQMRLDEQQRDVLSAQRDDAQKMLELARERARQDRDTLHDLSLQEQSLQTRIASLENATERARSQYQQLQSRSRQLELLIQEAEQPIAGIQRDLEQKLESRLAVEQRLVEARQRVQEEDHRLREAEHSRHQLEQQASEVRGRLEGERLDAQTVQVRLNTVEEQITKTGRQIEELLARLPEEATEESWERELQRMGNAIQRLGPINLAAIDEYQAQLERKQYLDAQNEDLESALATLENAIRRIDRETRTRFKETFDQINHGLNDLFPRVFEGGHAYLELTGDDLLSTGVTIMARPPGKRNTTIHLLSGGEKALTAIALVFSIFQLNPSPFCMLDEVDAPLDDANVGRFTQLVKTMAERVQFVVITHNKITMETAGQLMGVTMNEPGVSRLVSVDVDAAIELAETA